LALCGASAALAADLPYRASAPAYVPPPAFSWQGFYVGVHGGYGFGAFEAGGRSLFGSPTGGIVGVTGGYNFVPAPNILLGVEADFGFTGIRVSRSPFPGISTRGSIDNMVTARARLGYTLDRALLYVTGGYAGTGTTLNINNPFGFRSHESTFQSGWAVGAGLEFMLTNSISAKGEYLFTSVGSDRWFTFSPFAVQTGVSTSTLRAGVNFHF
jgi:outer membrane immunogenic protein